MALVSVYVDGYVVPVNRAADWCTRPHIKHPWNGPAVEWTQVDWIEIAATWNWMHSAIFISWNTLTIATIDIIKFLFQSTKQKNSS